MIEFDGEIAFRFFAGPGKGYFAPRLSQLDTWLSSVISLPFI